MMADKKLILIVEDEKDLATMIKNRVESAGYDVRIAGDGTEALEALKTISPDLIILDIQLPHMDGIEFYNKITDETGKTQYPVLVLTVRVELRKYFEEMNVEGFLCKPFEGKELLQKISEILGE